MGCCLSARLPNRVVAARLQLILLDASARLFGYCRGEIGILVGYPIDEFANRRVSQQAVHIHPIALQFGIGEVRGQGLLANGVHRHDIAPAPALGHRMMPDECLAGRSAA